MVAPVACSSCTNMYDCSDPMEGDTSVKNQCSKFLYEGEYVSLCKKVSKVADGIDSKLSEKLLARVNNMTLCPKQFFMTKFALDRLPRKGSTSDAVRRYICHILSLCSSDEDRFKILSFVPNTFKAKRDSVWNCCDEWKQMLASIDEGSLTVGTIEQAIRVCSFVMTKRSVNKILRKHKSIIDDRMDGHLRSVIASSFNTRQTLLQSIAISLDDSVGLECSDNECMVCCKVVDVVSSDHIFKTVNNIQGPNNGVEQLPVVKRKRRMTFEVPSGINPKFANQYRLESLALRDEISKQVACMTKEQCRHIKCQLRSGELPPSSLILAKYVFEKYWSSSLVCTSVNAYITSKMACLSSYEMKIDFLKYVPDSVKRQSWVVDCFGTEYSTLVSKANAGSLTAAELKKAISLIAHCMSYRNVYMSLLAHSHLKIFGACIDECRVIIHDIFEQRRANIACIDRTWSVVQPTNVSASIKMTHEEDKKIGNKKRKLEAVGRATKFIEADHPSWVVDIVKSFKTGSFPLSSFNGSIVHLQQRFTIKFVYNLLSRFKKVAMKKGVYTEDEIDRACSSVVTHRKACVDGYAIDLFRSLKSGSVPLIDVKSAVASIRRSVLRRKIPAAVLSYVKARVASGDSISVISDCLPGKFRTCMQVIKAMSLNDHDNICALRSLSLNSSELYECVKSAVKYFQRSWLNSILSRFFHEKCVSDESRACFIEVITQLKDEGYVSNKVFSGICVARALCKPEENVLEANMVDEILASSSWMSFQK